MILEDLIRQQSPALAQVMGESGGMLIGYTLQWFICIFINALPFSSVVRIWDVIMLEGDKALIRVGLALLSIYERDLVEAKEMDEIAMIFR